jgi:hypothetical protein
LLLWGVQSTKLLQSSNFFLGGVTSWNGSADEVHCCWYRPSAFRAVGVCPLKGSL